MNKIKDVEDQPIKTNQLYSNTSKTSVLRCNHKNIDGIFLQSPAGIALTTNWREGQHSSQENHGMSCPRISKVLNYAYAPSVALLLVITLLVLGGRSQLMPHSLESIERKPYYPNETEKVQDTAEEWWQSAGRQLSRIYLSRVDDHHGWCSQDTKSLYYIKIMKCASSTGAGVALNVAHNVAQRENVSHCAVAYNHFQTQKQKGLATRDRERSLLWTTVRHPAKRAISSYFFKKVSRQGNDPSDDAIMNYCRSQKGYQRKDLTRGEFRSQRWDQVFTGEMDFVAVAERMAESLVVFRLLNGLEPEDVIVLSSKSAGGYDDGKTKEGCKKILKAQISSAVSDYFSGPFVEGNEDYILYAAANTSLDRTIDSLGRDLVEREVQHHHTLQRLAEEQCLSEAAFPCSDEGVKQVEKSRLSCYGNDFGCGHECVRRALQRHLKDLAT